MRKFNNKFLDTAYLGYRWVSQVLDPLTVMQGLPAFTWYFRDWVKYSRMTGA